MKNTKDEKSGLPAYIRLYRQLREDIRKGAYPYGSRLPSGRTLADETKLSLLTVRHAMALLCDEGYAEARQRSGCFAVYRVDDFPDAAPPVTDTPVRRSEPQETGDFPFSVLARTMRKVLLDYNEKLLTKAPNQGCPELRSELCAYLFRSRGIEVSPEQVIVGSGAEYLYGLIAQLLGREKVFALEDPCYEQIRKVYESLGVMCELLPLRADGIDSAGLWRSGAGVLHTTPYHSFPSGISVSSPKKQEYLLWAEKRHGVIVEDNYDSELTVSSKAEDSLFLMAGGKNVIYVNTFSRIIAPSVRVGYMVLPEDLAEAFHRKLGFYSCTVPAFDQYVLAELLHSGDLERHINRVRRRKRKELAGV